MGFLKYKLSKKNRIVLGALTLLFSIALFIAFISFLFTWQEDYSVIQEFANREATSENWLNKLGAGLGYFLMYQGFGLAAFILVYICFRMGIFLFINGEKKELYNRLFWSMYLMTIISLFFGFFSSEASILSGVIGYELHDFLYDYIGNAGLILLLCLTTYIYLLFCLELTPDKILSYIKSKRESLSVVKERAMAESVSKEEETLPITTDEIEDKQSDDIDPDAILSKHIPDYNEIIGNVKDEEEPLEITLEERTVAEKPLEINVPEEEPKIEEEPNPIELPKPVEESKPVEEEEPSITIEVEKTVQEKESSENLSDKLVDKFGEFDPTLDLQGYQFPVLNLLKEYEVSNQQVDSQELEEYKERIIKTLQDYKIEISSIKATIGPTVTLYEIIPEAGVRISKIKNLEDDIALALAALGIRIIAPMPGKGTVGIEVPNKNPQMVAMKTVIASQKFQQSTMELPIALGKTISNETFVFDLAKMPHLLMAGATGQGKSVGLNAILTSLLYKKHPAEVKFVLVDPKKVELTLFNKIERHFLAKLPDSEDAIITDNSKVINTLNSLCIEMDDRYELLKNASTRNIKEYNEKFKKRKLNPENGHRFLPYIVLVVDEFADLIMTAGKEVETPIARLAQLARAIGIHLIIATQRPSVNVITGIIKANFPARIAFRVTSMIDSKTILDSKGADQLIGRGDLLYTQGNDLVRVQCAFVDTPEVEQITEFIGEQRAYPDAYLLPEYQGEEAGESVVMDTKDRDACFREAAEIIVTTQQGSTSLLQRKLKLGYNRSGRIIDQLEAAGIVGPFEGSKARKVFVKDIAALDELLNNES